MLGSITTFVGPHVSLFRTESFNDHLPKDLPAFLLLSRQKHSKYLLEGKSILNTSNREVSNTHHGPNAISLQVLVRISALSYIR